MKVNTPGRLFCLLFSILVFILSCKSQETVNNSDLNPDDSVLIFRPDGDLDSQIAEYIRHVYQDKNGGLWFGTNNYGIAHYNGDSLSYYSNDQGFGGGQITGVTEDLDKNIWFATNQGIVKYEWTAKENGDKKFANYTVPKLFKGGHFWSIFADSKGNVWAGTGSALFLYNGKKWDIFELPYSKDEASIDLLTDVTTWCVTEDRKGNIWFGTNENGAIKYDPSAELEGDKAYVQYTTEDGLTDNNVDAIMEDRRGDIWMGTRFGGLNRLNLSAEKVNERGFTNYTQQDSSIGNNEICSLFEDSAGYIWFSSEGYGVYRFDGSSLTNYGKNQGLGVRAVQTIFEDREGRLWVGGGGGLYRYYGGLFFNVTKNGDWK